MINGSQQQFLVRNSKLDGWTNAPIRPGVRFHDLLTVSLNGAGVVDHVINHTGGPVTPTLQGPSTVVDHP